MSFADDVRAVLADTDSLPIEFKDFLIQHEAQHALAPGALIAPSHNATGLNGATAGGRFVGATTSGAPTTGYFKTGDFIVDQSGTMWVCITAGSPGTWKNVGSSSLPVPGQILQSYVGRGTVSDFSWSTANAETSSGFPSNPTFTKLQDSSKLVIYANADLTTGTNMPNVVAMGLWIDGGLEENIFHHVDVAGAITSVAWSKLSSTPYSAGSHTLDMRVWFLNGPDTFTLRSKASVDLGIFEVSS